MKENLNFKKNFIWNILGTGFNAFNSLFLLIIVTRINGVNDAGIFTIAFATACILYVIGTYSGRIFQVTENNNSITDKDFIVNRVISFLLMIMCAAFFVIIRGYDSYKSGIFLLLALYKGLEAFSDVLYGIMQKRDLLYKVGQSYFIKALLTVLIFLVIDYFSKNLMLSCISIILVWIGAIVLFDYTCVKKLVNIKEKVNWKETLNLFKKGFFVFAITFLGLYVMNAPKYAIDSMLESSYQTIFGIIVMPATVIGLFGQFLIHPFLNNFVKLNENKQYEELRKLKRKLVIYIAGFGAISSILAYTIGIPVLQLIYGIDLQNYNIMLTLIIIASTLYNIGMIYSNILTTMRFTFIQFVIYVIVSSIALIVSNVLTKADGIRGSSIAYFIIMFILFLMYFVIEKIILKRKEKE